MKKLLTLLMAIALTTCLVACGETADKPKEVENMEVTLTFPVWNGPNPVTITRAGTYTGTMLNDLPNGIGKFETQNEAGKPWYYEGEFKDGLFHGQGVQSNADTEELDVGTFVDGLFTPTKSEFYSYISQFEPKFALQEKSSAVIAANDGIFPCTTEEATTAAVALTDFTVQHKQLSKSVDNYLEKLARFQNMTATQVFEEDLYGHKLTQIIACDSDFNYFTVYFDGTIELYDGDVFELYGLPVASSSFSNVGGGTTNVIVMVASIINVAK